MTKYQIATKPGHRSTEHLFVILSLMSLYEMTGKCVLILMYDIKAYFDSESIFDCLSELYKGQIRGRTYRLLFNLNKTSKIKVKTSVGESCSVYTNPLVTQGSVEAAVISAKNLDSGVEEYLHSEKETDTEDHEEEESSDKDKEKMR